MAQRDDWPRAGAGPGHPGDPAPPAPGDAAARARRETLTDEARGRHDALTAAIERLERALSAAAGRREAWSERVAGELERVGDAVRAHVDGMEEPGGLFEEVQRAAPRLSRSLAALAREHPSLVARTAALAGRFPADESLDVHALRREATELLVSLREHRAFETDLIYEAFWTDLGAAD